MARRKRSLVEAAPVAEEDSPPPLEIRRCPWTRWDNWAPDRFEEWLQERQRWRETHTRTLPRLSGRDRLVLRWLQGEGAALSDGPDQLVSTGRS